MELLLEKTRKVFEQVYLDCQYVPPVKVNTAKFLKAIGEISGFKIAAIELPAEDMPHLRGMLLPFLGRESCEKYLQSKPHLADHFKYGSMDAENSAIILTSSANNQCWARFTVIKEACHLYSEDTTELAENSDVYTTARVLVDLPCVESSCAGDKERFAREIIGIIAAIEIFMPERIKEWMAREVNVEKNTPYQIAKKLMIPERFVEYRLREWGLIERS